MRVIIVQFVSFFILQKINAQNVGIGTNTPSEKLEVIGNIKADTLKPNAILFLPNDGATKILASDVNGNGSWQLSSIVSENETLKKKFFFINTTASNIRTTNR